MAFDFGAIGKSISASALAAAAAAQARAVAQQASTYQATNQTNQVAQQAQQIQNSGADESHGSNSGMGSNSGSEYQGGVASGGGSSSGGGGGGGGVAGSVSPSVTPEPAYNPATDPAYLARVSAIQDRERSQTLAKYHTDQLARSAQYKAAADAEEAANATSTITVPDPTADPTYKAQHADYAKALGDFINNQALQSSQYNSGYNTGLRKLGWNGKGWDQGDTTEGYGSSFTNNAEDFAARGLYNSGAYGKSVNDINNQFADQKTDLDTGKTDFQDTARNALHQYQGQNSSDDANARRDAIARIAQKYGVDPDDLTAGSATNFTLDAKGNVVSHAKA